MSDKSELIEALARCEEDRVKTLIHEKIEAQVPISEIVTECNHGMAELGERFAREECFLPELMYGGMIMKSVMAELQPQLEGSESGPASGGTVLMGSVQHDVHDIGKDIVIMMLRGVGYDVVDLGVDVPPEKFVEAIRQHQPAVVGMSVLLTTCYKSVTATVDAIKEAGLRDNVALMVGGAAASNLLAESSGCDYYGKSAVDGVNYAKSVVAVN